MNRLRLTYSLIAFFVAGFLMLGAAVFPSPARASVLALGVIQHDETKGIGTEPVGVGVDPGTDRAYIANLLSSTVSVVDTTTNRVLRVLAEGDLIGSHPGAVAVDPESHHAYVGNYSDGTVSVIDTRSDNVTTVIPHDEMRGIGSHPSGVAIDPARHRAYVTNYTAGTVSVIDTVENSVLRVIPHDPRTSIGSKPTGVAVDSSQGRVYVANSDEGTVSVIDAVTATVLKVIPHDVTNGIGNGPNSIAVDEVLHRAVVVSELSSTVSIIDTTRDAVVKVLGQAGGGIGEKPFGVAADAESGQAYVANSGDDTVSVIDTASGLTAGILNSTSSIGTSPRAVGIDPGHAQAYVLNSGASTVSVLSTSATAPLSRIGGADRFAVSATASIREFAPGVPVAYIASGTTFTDALSGSAAAGSRGGPVLLITQDSVPPQVSAELTRLRPQKIVVLGGPNSISDAVLKTLTTYAPSVARVGGADRFAVSANVSADAFPSRARVAYVASGSTFADALSGSAVAARDDAPMLLTQRESVPESVMAELKRLRPARIIILGGLNSVSADVQAALQAVAPATRLDGTDRFVVAAAAAQSAFPAGASTVFIASGTVFPDALSGSAAASVNGAPVLLVTRDSIPDPIANELQRLKPSRIVVLGGPATVSQTVYADLRHYLS